MHLTDLFTNLSQERVSLDFKEVHWIHGSSDSKKWQAEFAKDVAAMANSMGGHIVVGAAEKNEILVKFIDPRLPSKWESALMKVIATWLVPEPAVTMALHEFDESGTQQLVVAIEPSIQPVVVRDPSDDRKRMSLPIRRGTQTVYLYPSEAIAVLNNPYRALQIRFNQIAEIFKSGNLKSLEILCSQSGPDNSHRIISGKKWQIEKVHADLVYLSAPDEKMILPFYFVKAVHPIDSEFQHWRIIYRGHLTSSSIVPGYREVVPLL